MGTTRAPVTAYYKRDFWARENLKYVTPHFRLKKAARLVNKLAAGRDCKLLDVGCGPATLMRLLDHNIHYHGIDMAIHTPSPDLVQMDFVENPICFGEKKFDIVIAQGVFEYIGKVQLKKLLEISRLLRPGGRFIVSYVNFDHHKRVLYEPYNNIQIFAEFRDSVGQVFNIDRTVPTSHNWRHREPDWWLIEQIHMGINCTIPLISRLFAVEYFLVCSSREDGAANFGHSKQEN